jgi:hypothetical protein
MAPDDKKPKENDTIEVIVNGRPKEVAAGELSFAEVVALAFESPPHGNDTIFSVTYRKGGNEHRPEGILVEGDSVKVKKGTTFNVSATNRS